MEEKKIKKRKSLSIQDRITRKAIISILILHVVTLFIVFVLYVLSMAGECFDEGREVGTGAAKVVWGMEDLHQVIKEMEFTYNSAAEELDQTGDHEQYMSRFARFEGNEKVEDIRILLNGFSEDSVIGDMFIVGYDLARKRVVSLVDSGRKTHFVSHGEQEAVESLIHPVGTFITDEMELSFDERQDVSGDSIFYELGHYKGKGIAISAIPLDDKNKSFKVYVVTEVALLAKISSITEFLKYYIISMLVANLIFYMLMLSQLKKTLVRPINRIANAAREYIRDKEDGVLDEVHFSNLDIHTGDELEKLSDMLADMEQSIGNYEQNLAKVSAEKEHIQAELQLAAKIQADMLPSTFPAFPERSEFEIFASMVPAKEVGGDFYDFFLVDDDHLALVIADVSGKGVPAALFMAKAKMMIMNRVQRADTFSTGEILTEVNRQLCSSNDDEMFVTVWLAILQISTGKGLASNAGHEHPAIKRAGGAFELHKYPHSPGMAFIDGVEFEEHPMELHAGDCLYVYTDGVPEATNGKEELFGEDRMLEALNRTGETDPAELAGEMRRATDEFVGEAERFDDMTMLAIRWFGPAQ